MFRAKGKMDEYSTRQLQRLLEGLEAVRKGDLTARLRKEREDVFGELADSYNGMVELIGGLADEVSRVAAVAGEKGELDERASVLGVEGSWKTIVDTLNSLIGAIATPMMEVRRVLVAMSKGDLTQKVALEKAAGDFKAIGDTINQTVSDLGVLIRKSGVVSERVLVGYDQVASSSTQVNAALRQVADIVGQVAEGTQTQSKRLEETTKVVADLSTSVQQGAVNARSAADTTAEAAKLAAKGTEAGKEGTYIKGDGVPRAEKHKETRGPIYTVFPMLAQRGFKRI